MVDLLPSAEQRQIVDSIARYLDSELPVQRLIGVQRDPALAPAAWAALAGLSWLGIGLGEDHGGAGFTLVEAMLLFRELGRVLAPPQLFGAVLGARLAADAAQESLCTSILAGRMRIAPAIPLDGDECFLLDEDAAELTLILRPSGAELMEIESLGHRKPVRSIDESVVLTRAEARNVAPVCRAEGSVYYHEALVLSSAYLAGIIEAVKSMAVSYAGMRHQFGQAIGGFQAVKHRCADIAIRAEAAGAQAAFAALAVRDERPDRAFQALAAKIVAGSYAISSAQENIQLHGAIGTTAELPAHLYLKRAHLLDECFASARLAKREIVSCAPIDAA